MSEFFTTPEGASIEVSSAGPWTTARIYDILLSAGLDTLLGPTYKVIVQDTTASSTGASAQQRDGVYSQYAATSYLKGMNSNFAANPEAIGTHEFGHAWTLYHLYMSQNGVWDSYLKARAIADDPRLESSYVWSKSELIADDYRLLFGSTLAVSQMPKHMNSDLPQPSQVAGLKDWFTFVWAKGAVAPPTPPTPPPGPVLTVPGIPVLTGTPGLTSVALGWSAPADGGSPLTGYRIYRNGALVAAVSGLSYTDSPLASSTGYMYTGSATNAIGEGQRSSPLAVTTLTAPAPVPVAILSAAASPTTVKKSTTISWNLSQPATLDVTIYNDVGQVRNLLHRSVPTGAGNVVWNRTTDSGARAPVGKYTVRIHATDASGASADRTLAITAQ